MPVRVRWFFTFCLLLFTIAFSTSRASAQFVDKKTLSLAAAKKIAAAAEAEAVKNKWTMAIAVLDDGGHLIYLERMDGTQIGSIEVAQGKASTAVRFKRPTKDFEDAITANHLALITVSGISAIRGGLPVILDGNAVGAIGVSGGDPQQDEQCAEAGLAALH
jgi:glc operon protein GlcG